MKSSSMRRFERPTRRQAAAAAALGLTGVSAYAASRYAPGPTAVRPVAAVKDGAAHAPDFIPSADAPRVDGRLTLIWFSEPE